MGQLVERWLTMREVRDPVLVEISFGLVGRAVAYNARGPWIRGKTWSTVQMKQNLHCNNTH